MWISIISVIRFYISRIKLCVLTAMRYFMFDNFFYASFVMFSSLVHSSSSSSTLDCNLFFSMLLCTYFENHHLMRCPSGSSSVRDYKTLSLAFFVCLPLPPLYLTSVGLNYSPLNSTQSVWIFIPHQLKSFILHLYNQRREMKSLYSRFHFNSPEVSQQLPTPYTFFGRFCGQQLEWNTPAKAQYFKLWIGNFSSASNPCEVYAFCVSIWDSKKERKLAFPWDGRANTQEKKRTREWERKKT